MRIMCFFRKPAYSVRELGLSIGKGRGIYGGIVVGLWWRVFSIVLIKKGHTYVPR